MPRNGSGLYSLPEPPFVPGTVISSTDVNSDFDDIADALTASVAADGQTPMTGALKMSADGFNYVVEPTSGMYRKAALTQAIKIGGTDKVTITGDGAAVDGIVSADSFVRDGVPVAPIAIGTVVLYSGSTAPDLWVFAGSTLNRAAYPDLWELAEAEIALGNTFYGNGNGTTTFTVGTMDGYAPVGVDGSGTTLPNVTHIGDTTGNKTATLITANLPAYTPSGTITNGAITINQDAASTAASTTPGGVFDTVTGAAATITASQAASTFAGAAQGGTSTPFSLAQPSRAFKFIVYAGA